MNDYTTAFILGYVNAEQWASGIKQARDKHSGIDEKRIWELIEEQDKQWSGHMKEEVDGLLELWGNQL